VVKIERMTLKFLVVAATLMALFIMASSAANAFKPNYDETKVRNFPLTYPLKMENGESVTTREMWFEKRRPELLRLFEHEEYGRAPEKPADLVFEKTSEDKHALGGKATRQEVSIYFSKDKSGPHIDVLLYIPNESRKPAPAFVGLNFGGNHTVSAEPGIKITTNWVANDKAMHITNHRANAQTRGKSASRWPLDLIIGEGYALATAYYGDIDPDFDDGFQNGVHPLFYKNGQTRPAPDEWGSIAAWAWGLSRILDYLETDPAIDGAKVAVIGHSRLGKTALWAGATDERFALTVSNDSGCGGAALSKRIFGETVGRINDSFPHWFCANFKKYNENEGALPMDQHELIALIAPRPVYVASAHEDQWADPKGEFLGAKLASPVYKLLGTKGLPAEEMPELSHPVMGQMGYHIRPGKHDITKYDWEQYLNFADRHFGRNH
jgi:hypothetical protein